MYSLIETNGYYKFKFYVQIDMKHALNWYEPMRLERVIHIISQY